jgi:hypothetical protein
MILAVNLLCLGTILGYAKTGAFACLIVTCVIGVHNLRKWNP